MSEILLTKLQELIKAGLKFQSEPYFQPWRNRVLEFLSQSFGKEAAEKFSSISSDINWSYARMSAVGHLEGHVAKLGAKIENISIEPKDVVENILSSSSEKLERIDKAKVFIVHGHDNEAKESVARFIEKIGLIPIILHEQANSGRTIIEKFEVYSDVSYAVVLLTPDDAGSSVKESDSPKSRARQNVILELGYFIGKLGRNRVCALNKGAIEIPSDYHGILYVSIDSQGAWKTKLSQEFVQAGLNIKLEGLLG